MNLTHLGDGVLRYTSLDIFDYGAGGQIYGMLEGSITGERIQGDLLLTNLAMMRPDGVNLPTLRGMLTTHDSAKIFVVIDGMALARPADGARVIAGSMSFRTGDERYTWLNTIFAVVEGVLDKVTTGGVVHVGVHACELTIEADR